MNENNFWKTARGKSTLKMLLWLVFIVILIIVFINKDNTYNPSNEETDEPIQTTFRTYEEMRKDLLNNNFAYIYEIKIEENLYIYSGYKFNGKELGFKETKDGITKYYIENENMYQVILDNKEENNTLYENIDSSFLDLELLFDNLEEYLYSVDKGQETRTITYNKDGYGVVVKTNLENITNITITIDSNVYNLSFFEIGKSSNLTILDK